MADIIKLWKHLTKRRQKQFWLVFLLMIIASLSEIVSVGAVLPFLGVLTAPEQIYQHHLMQPVIHLLELSEANQLVLPLTILFISAALFAGVIRLTLLYAMTRLSFATGADISINIYRRTLYQDYTTHVSRNSSEVINGIITKSSTVIGGILNPTLMLTSSIVLLIGIMSALFVIDIVVALVSFISFAALYWGIIRYTRNRLRENSQCIANQSTLMIKALQEGLGGIRDVLIDGSQRFYCNLYRNADLPLRRASGNNVFITGSPRYAMEAVGMVLIAGLAYVMTQREGGVATAVPILGALALGAQRLLPALQHAYGAYTNIKGAHASFQDVLSLLEQPLPDYADLPPPTPINFDQAIKLQNISFRYSEDTDWVLRDIDLVITKGSRTGFIGATGCGKSTLLDIIMGLLPVTKGTFFVDGQSITVANRRSWQAHIAHVPQNIYLSDSTIEENIAFGITKEKINHQQVKEAAKQAQLDELISSWPNKYQTFVGERGIRLSGGQRQRIGIARALYKKANVLIFDEATSALDNETENAVMESIEKLGRDLTILIIAHRVTTLKGCDQVVEVSKDGICTKKYQDLNCE